MEDLPPLRVQLNGILLSTLLFECANARVDYEGLILGAIVSKVRSVVDDTSDTRVRTVYTTVVVQGIYKLEPNLPKFYGRSGEINEAILEQYSIPSNLSILGYLKYRRSEEHILSLRDRAVAYNLKQYLERRLALSSSPANPYAPRSTDPFPITVALFTAKTNENLSTHDYDYSFWKIGDNEQSLEAIPVQISNMIESPQEDYQSFQSNLAFGASRHPASLGMMNTIRSVGSIALVDGHETMFKDSFEATKSLTKSVLASEQSIKDARQEIEKIKEQIENAKVSQIMRKMERTKQETVPETRRQITGQSTFSSPHQSSQIAFPKPGSPPDLLY